MATNNYHDLNNAYSLAEKLARPHRKITGVYDFDNRWFFIADPINGVPNCSGYYIDKNTGDSKFDCLLFESKLLLSKENLLYKVAGKKK